MPADVEFARLWQSEVAGIELFSAQLYRHSFAKHMHEALHHWLQPPLFAWGARPTKTLANAM